MVTIRNETSADVRARNALLDLAYGPVRFKKPSEKLRRGRLPADGLSLVACDGGRIVGTVRLWNVDAGGGRPALLLGPLAVHPDWRNRGVGGELMRRALRNARLTGHRAVLLVGDADYYGRFGFTADKSGALVLPGLHERHRLLGLELASGALDGARGLIAASGRPARAARPAASGVSFHRAARAA
ncbi:MAG TPA: N-acetyltransferase [Xanthobacteraceae bacterium]|nr:N-acetyltransferase [Xanthobacteraceae bacterium]